MHDPENRPRSGGDFMGHILRASAHRPKSQVAKLPQSWLLPKAANRREDRAAQLRPTAPPLCGVLCLGIALSLLATTAGIAMAVNGEILQQQVSNGKGYTVLPINPKEPEIAGLQAYPTVGDAPPPIHIVNFVTPPAVTRNVLDTLDPAVVDTVWFQDGSWDDDVIASARARFPHVVHQACIMVVTNY